MSAKKIWDRLEVTHEGTNQVKESKINMLVHNYELFKMKPEGSITQILARFIDIINGLKTLNKCYSNSDLVRKVLRLLPRSWKAKVITIQEAKDLNVLLLEKLLGSLMTHELTMKQHTEEETRRKRTIALKSTAQEEDDSEKSDNNEEDEDLALITRKFRSNLPQRNAF